LWNGRLKLPCDLHEWFDTALSYPGIRLIEITPTIAIWSTRLPGKFHRDPADQIIVATAMTYMKLRSRCVNRHGQL
jgi:PIN domain nuclease of toxin-antitoxin system